MCSGINLIHAQYKPPLVATAYMYVVTFDTIYIISCRISHIKCRIPHNLLYSCFSVQYLGVFDMDNNEKQFNNSERYRDLGCAISYYRKRKGFTQEQVAEQIGISRQHMGAIEAPNMVRAISLDVLFNIATVLEIEPYLLLKFSPDK